jgi:hypothetical protein
MDDKGVVVIALPHRFAELARAIERLPGGLREEHFNRVGELIYVSYRVANQLLQEDRGAVAAEPPATVAISSPFGATDHPYCQQQPCRILKAD